MKEKYYYNNSLEIIKIENLEKTYKVLDRKSGMSGMLKNIFVPKYKYHKAVKGISFDVMKGDIAGFIGPNGAGKSTTIKMMSGILSPSGGSVNICGVDPFKEKKIFSKKMGIVFGQRSQLWWDIPVNDSYMLFKTMYKITDNDYKKRINMFDDILGIGGFINKPTRQLSLGQRVRADMCAALLHNPEVLFLDEPTIGLDVVVKEKIRDFIIEINKEYQTSIILTTHDIGDIEKLSKKIIVIDEGNIIYDGNLNELKENYGRMARVSFETENYEIGKLKSKLPTCKILLSDNNKITIVFDKNDIDLTFVLSKILEMGLMKNIQIEETGLEDIVKNIYSKKIRG